MAPSKTTENIISGETGAVIGSRVIKRRADGIVVIDFAGLQKTGRPLSLEDHKVIQLGRWRGRPRLKHQRV